MYTLVQGLMNLRKVDRSGLSLRSKVSLTAISRFLNGEGELKSSSLLNILSTLGVDVEGIVKKELARALGVLDEQASSEDFSFLLDKVEPITRKMIADMLIGSFKDENGPEMKSRIERFKRYRDSIKTVGRANC